MKKSLLLILLGLQSTAAFASTQVLKCKGTASDELGEIKTPVFAEIKILNPYVQSLLVINGEEAANARASIKVLGVPGISLYGINVTNMRKSISFSGVVKGKMLVSAYVPVPAIGVEGAVKADLSLTDSNNITHRALLSCESKIINSL